MVSRSSLVVTVHARVISVVLVAIIGDCTLSFFLLAWRYRMIAVQSPKENGVCPELIDSIIQHSIHLV